MRVRALTSFVGRVDGRKYIVKAGDVLTLPEGADWLRAGLVEAAEPAPELEPEKPVKKKAKKAE
jgi:hypothetical protein